MILTRNTLAPFAHVLFCVDNPDECTTSGTKKSIYLSAQKWRQLNRINRSINRAIRPVHDLASSGLEDVWSVKPRAGDCEDYALTKRSQLIKMGWPTGALSIATVYAPRVGHHAVLVVRTNRGDYVLDNLKEKILPWKRTGYRWNKVQTPENPMLWATI